MVEFGISSAFRGWVRVRVLGYGFRVRGKKVKSRDCALASDLVRATQAITMRAWPVARSIFDAPYVREANEGTASWITQATMHIHSM